MAEIQSIASSVLTLSDHSLQSLADAFKELELETLGRQVLRSSIATSSLTSFSLEHHPLANRLNIGVIADCIEKINVLININKPIVGDPAPKNLLISSLSHRSEFYLPDKFDGGEYELYNLEKFQQDLSSIVYALKTVLNDMKNTNGYTVLSALMDSIKKKNNKEKTLLEEVRDLKEYYEQLKTAVGKEKLLVMKKTRKISDAIKELKLRIQDEREYLEAKATYIRKWQNARVEQNKMVVDGKEEGYRFIVSDCMDKTESEDNVHKCITDFLRESKDDFQNEIEVWMEKYDKDLDQKELDIANKRVDLERLIAKKDQLAEELQRRQTKMDDFIEYKRQKKISAILTRVQTRAVTKIQIWWREVMRQKGLGPYRKRKKGGKNKNKKK